MTKKKILLSAYACHPNLGAEAMLGWEWGVRLAKKNNNVTVITSAVNKKEIIKYCNNLDNQIQNLKFIFYDVTCLLPWLNLLKSKFRYFYYYAWQWGAFKFVERIHKFEKFDIVHHVTWVQLRLPSFMGGLGIPFIYGPIGGGEKSPYRLRKIQGFRQWSIDFLRDLWSFTARFDPFLRYSFKSACKVIVTSEQSRNLIPRHFHYKTIVQLAIAYDSNYRNLIHSEKRKELLNVLYVGRFLCLKGMKLGIKAFSELLRIYPNSKLTLIGDGPDKRKWLLYAEKLNIEKSIIWIDWLPRNKVESLYKLYDIFLFPSLHDSGGFVILEALSNGLPVVCLNLGGPSTIVDSSCGLSIPVHGKTKAQIENDLSKALIKIAQSPLIRQKLSAGAYARVKKFNWDNHISKCYSGILNHNLKNQFFIN